MNFLKVFLVICAILATVWASPLGASEDREHHPEERAPCAQSEKDRCVAFCLTNGFSGGFCTSRGCKCEE
uniref:Defensin TY 1 n=1 Tax=Tabanus yao TaxID=485572 RepID=C1IBY5_TABYA|nr:defensin TY 1 [Tabanus yao]